MFLDQHRHLMGAKPTPGWEQPPRRSLARIASTCPPAWEISLQTFQERKKCAFSWWAWMLQASILNKRKLGGIVTSIPTIGFRVETVEYKSISFTVWDVDGQDKIRSLWRHYFQNTQGLIFVADSNDRERVNKAGEELMRMLAEDELRDADAILLFANKQDLPNAMNAGSQANWGCTLYAAGTGTFRLPVPPAGTGSMKD